MDMHAALLQHFHAQKADLNRDYLSETLLILHTQFWGNALPSENPWDVHIKIKPWKWTNGNLLVLDQHPQVLALIQKLRQPVGQLNGVLITGSPGIGKTSCLWYLLITALCAAEPVILLYDSCLFVLIESGVYTLHSAADAEVVRHEAFEGVLCLVDLDEKDSDIRSTVLSYTSECFTVAASSPNRDRYHSWVKQARIATYVLDTPTYQDFKTLAWMGHIDGHVVERRLPKLLDVYGPDIRALLEVLPASDEELPGLISRRVQQIYTHLMGLSDDELHLLFASPDKLNDSFSHTLVYTYAGPAGLPHKPSVLHRIRTPLVLRLVLKVYQIDRTVLLPKMYDLLSRTSHLAVSRGWVFEVLCHAFICSEDTIDLQPMRREGTVLVQVRESSPTKVSIGERKIEVYTLGSKVATTTSSTHYYVPAESNNPAFDSFLHGHHSLAFQMFIGRGHSFKPNGMSTLRKRLRAFDPTRDWKRNKIGFVFVVPRGYDFEVLVPQKQFIDIDFFTLEVDIPLDKYEYFGSEERCPDGDDSDIEMEEEGDSDS